MGEMGALHALLMHPHITGVHGEVVARGAGAEHDHAAALHHEAGDREGRLAWMLEHAIHVHALAGDVPYGLAEAADLFRPGVVFRRADRWHLAPAFEIVAVDDALGAERKHIISLLVVGDDTDGVGAGGGAELHGHG